ncbi:UDP-2,4-diacetamido-2,4,6-trideoxy-beta-L-altropyranose hydrolase [Lebetimonas sp. JH369]|uniref:UDP-2,4-diacetamido-2,4, 6-trideoxy-beta-L-altropyranose hydrolase n=1 Tax=Lebetimonas sp. JH369 TaxID=990069 RepID=UPI000467B0AB|nr:UDP-2,4-diacetamido-2,4,6-trideoxy-beta-L-altropyranose hydrolase [Lebetimonas sp. JH369]
MIIRVDFSSKIGLGHLKRMETFIKKYNIKNSLIICKECNKKLTSLPVVKIKKEKEFFKKVKKLKPQKVIVDNYNFTYENEKEFKKLFPEIKLIVFDDLYYRHYADEVINVNLYAKKEKYIGKIPPFCKVTILPPLIREEFQKAKKKKDKKEGIFISFGGTDAKGIGLKVLKELKKLKFPVNFYTTSSNKNLIKLKRFCQVNKWCKLHIDENVAKGMAKSKFAIITPSTISWEAIHMNLPFIAIEIADNQKEKAKDLKEKRIPLLKIRDIRKISEKLHRFNIR